MKNDQQIIERLFNIVFMGFIFFTMYIVAIKMMER